MVKLRSLNGGTHNHRSRHQTSLAPKTQCMLTKPTGEVLEKKKDDGNNEFKIKAGKKAIKNHTHIYSQFKTSTVKHLCTSNLQLSETHFQNAIWFQLIQSLPVLPCVILLWQGYTYAQRPDWLLGISTFSYCRSHLAVQHLLHTCESRLVLNHEPRISSRLADRC